MTKAAIDTAYINFDAARYVKMSEDYTTTSFNLGERTYLSDHIYRVDEHMLAEIEAKAVGDEFTVKHCKPDPITKQVIWPITHCPIRPKVSVLSNVTRWFSANGHDTHFLTRGELSPVPSNLAAWLVEAGHATAA